MKIKVLLSAIMVATASTAAAQNIYDLGKFSSSDLSGTARYVGMGGAMNALGADLSVMSSNPAGIGLYRSSDAAVTASVASQADADKFNGKNPTHISFDQLGLVYAMKMNGETTKFFNIGFNYRKHNDFNSLINTGMNNISGNASQLWQLSDLATYWDAYAFDASTGDTYDGTAYFTPLMQAAYGNGLISAMKDAEGNHTGMYESYGATSNSYRKAQWGSIQDYDLAFAFNFTNQVYLGFTVGIYNVDYNSYSQYNEDLVNSEGASNGSYTLKNKDRITGTGVDMKVGVIFRPVKDNPFRIGIAVSTPTYYNLTRKYSMNGSNTYRYDYNLQTPWKFNFSLGSTFFNQLAIDAEYEYADYSKAKISYDNGDWDEWGNRDEDDDEAIKDEANKYLKGVSTFKIGAEWYVDPKVCLRAGYNYVSSPYEDKAFYNQYINSVSLDNATSTAYMNMSGINRWTFGLGINFGRCYADAAYLYQNQHGTFYPFNTQYGDETTAYSQNDAYLNTQNPTSAQMYSNAIGGTKIKMNRSKFVLTLGFRF